MDDQTPVDDGPPVAEMRRAENLRRPVPADHHEPARGDVVRVADGRPFAAAERRRAVMIGDLSRDLDTATSALGSIATALGMSTDALPGAIVERVETLVREREMMADELLGEPRTAATTDDLMRAIREGLQAGLDLAELQGLLDEHRACYPDPGPVFERGSEGEPETDHDVIARLIAARDEHEAGAAEVRSALGARDDETTLDAARRAREERNAQRVEVERLRVERDRAVIWRDGQHADMVRIVEALGLTSDARIGDAVDAIERLTRQRDALREADALRLYLARAIRGCDFKERRAIEADLRSEGVTPPGVLVSAEDAAVVRGVLTTAARWLVAEVGVSMDVLDELAPATRAWIAAGRPLASEVTR